MSSVSWNELKSRRLKQTRGISFEELLLGTFIQIEENPKHAGQQIMLFELKGYVWVVPFVEKGDEVFLKTIYPSRKYTKRYREGRL